MFQYTPLIFSLLTGLLMIPAWTGVYASSLPLVPPQVITHDVHAFSNGTWVENLAIRKKGEILVSLYNTPEVHHINPFDKQGGSTLAHRFNDDHSVLGIAELQDDIFAVVVGKKVDPLTGFTSNFSIWTLDFQKAQEAQAVKVLDIPEAQLLNGLTTLDKVSGTVLAADCRQGVVYRVSIPQRAYAIVIDDSSMKPSHPEIVQLGVNGLKIQQQTLFFTNTNQGSLASVPIHKDGTPAGPVKILAELNSVIDDFTTPNQNGVTFVADGSANTVVQINTRTGQAVVATGASDSPVLYNPTAAQFGRTVKDKMVLYVTTTGGQESQIPGIPAQGGKIVAVHGLIG